MTPLGLGPSFLNAPALICGQQRPHPTLSPSPHSQFHDDPKGWVTPDGELRAALSVPRRERGSGHLGRGTFNQQLVRDLEPLPLGNGPLETANCQTREEPGAQAHTASAAGFA